MKGNIAMRNLKYQLNYGSNLISTIPNFPAILENNRGILESLGKSIMEELESEEAFLIHGDFWSGKYEFPPLARAEGKVLTTLVS